MRDSLDDGFGSQLTARVDSGFADLLKETARHNQLSKAALIRQLLHIGYEEFTKDPKREHPKTDTVIRDLYGDRATAREMLSLNQWVKDAKDSRKGLVRQLKQLQLQVAKMERRLGMED